jgi:SAM-dependent methyltransferase
MKSDDEVKLLEREVQQLRAVVNALAKRHYGNFPVPPENLRLNVGTNTTEANYWAQGMNSSARVLHVFGKQPSGPILDWGCGSGRTLRWLLAYPAWCEHYHGTDVDRDAIKWLAAQGQKKVVACGDAPPLPYADETFVGLFAFSVLTHISPARHRAWYAELHRVLKKGATAYLTTLGPTGPAQLPEKSIADLAAKGHAYLENPGHYKSAAIVTEAYARRQLEGLFTLEEYKPRGYQNMDSYLVRRA